MADENTNVTNNEEQNPVVEEPVVEPTGDKEPNEPVVEEPTTEEGEGDNKEITPEQKAKAAYIALRYAGVMPPSL